MRGGTSTSRREAMYLCTYATHGEAWGGLLKHNNKDHRNRSGFVDSRQLAMFDTTKLLATSVAFA